MLAFWICYLALSFTFAAVLYLIIERPFLLLKDSLSSRGAKRSATVGRGTAEELIIRRA
jgi:peptidoglycan/LPS O-acetylase OafA/YrhL